MSNRNKERQTIVLREEDIPEGFAKTSYWSGTETASGRDPMQAINDGCYNGHVDYYVVYKDGKEPKLTPYWASIADGNAYLEGLRHKGRKKAKPSSVPTVPAAPEVDARQLAILERIACSLETLAAVAEKSFFDDVLTGEEEDDDVVCGNEGETWGDRRRRESQLRDCKPSTNGNAEVATPQEEALKRRYLNGEC